MGLMIIFSDSNLPLQSRDWADSVEREINKLEKTLKSVASNARLTEVVREVTTIQSTSISESDVQRLISEALKSNDSFVVNIDGGLVNSNYGGLEPIDGGKP